MKFGSWTYDGSQVDIILEDQDVDKRDFLIMENGKLSAQQGAKETEPTAVAGILTSLTRL